MRRRYFDAAGKPVELGNILGCGGEATVYEIVSRGKEAAKMYNQPSEEKAAKLRAMLADASPEVANVCTWPIALLHNDQGLMPVGFVMPKLDQSHSLDSLIVPAQRMRDFPGVDWRFIVHTARNLADAVGDVQRHGFIVGDLNENNVRVTSGGEVRFIDCDSFQVKTQERVFRCPVATLLYWPPELQGVSADAIERTANHDAFALAVLIFRLLFLGRHPYAGRFVGRGEQPDIPDLIRTHRFAYGTRSAERDVMPPPDALRLQQLPDSIVSLFEKAFSSSAAINGSRPNTSAWVDALDHLAKNLVRCSASTAHWYPGPASTCPWCEIERSVGTALFIGMQSTEATRTSATSVGQVDVDALWRAIAAVPAPAPPERLIPEPRELLAIETQIAPSSAVKRLVSLAKWIAIVSVGSIVFANTSAVRRELGASGFLVAIAVYLLGRLVAAISGWRHSPARQAAAALRSAWKNAHQELEAKIKDFTCIQEQLKANLAEHKQLRAKYEEELDRLRSKSRATQTHEHLQRYPIRALRLPGIGPAVIKSLESYGVSTADDVVYDRVRFVKGIGPKRAKALVAWKRQRELEFKFDPHHGVNQGAASALKQRYVARHEVLAGALAAGPRTLTMSRQQVEQIARDRSNALRGLGAHAEALLK